MSIKINLIPNSAKNHYFDLQLIFVFLAAILVLSLWHIVIQRNIDLVKTQYDALEQEQNLVVKKIESSKQESKEKIMLQKKSDELDELKKSQLFFIHLVTLLNENVVNSVCLTSLVVETYKAKIGGQAKTMFDIEQLIKKLSYKEDVMITVQKISRQNDLYNFMLLLSDGGV